MISIAHTAACRKSKLNQEKHYDLACEKLRRPDF